jgi:hypothetical protein
MTTMREYDSKFRQASAAIEKRSLRKALATEDWLEDHGMDADSRATCFTHQSWTSNCSHKH